MNEHIPLKYTCIFLPRFKPADPFESHFSECIDASFSSLLL